MTPRIRSRWLAALASCLCALGLLAAPTGTAAVPDIYFTRALPAGSLAQPVGVVGSRNGTNRLHLLERRGTVRTLETSTGALRSGYYLDLRSSVEDGGREQGLLGLAFDPRFRDGRPYVYAAYTISSGSLRIVRLRASSPTATSVAAATAVHVLSISHPTYTNHNGGQLAFGADGYLYVGTGDGGGAGDPLDNARDRTSLSGKILRIDVSRSCSGRNYCIPSDNPYAGSSTYRREIWAYGVRNPWRFSFDRLRGTLWVADVGQNRYEEVTRLGAQTAGANLGWPCREGPASYDSSRCTGGTRTGPLYWYDHDLGASVIGGYAYRGRQYATLVGGRYVFGDFVSGRVWSGASDGSRRLEANLPRLTAFGEGEGAELWAVTYDGALWRMRAR